MDELRNLIEDIWGAKRIPSVVCLGDDRDPEDEAIVQELKGKEIHELNLEKGEISEANIFRILTREGINYYIGAYFLLVLSILDKKRRNWCNSVLWLCIFLSGKRSRLLGRSSLSLAKEIVKKIYDNIQLFPSVELQLVGKAMGNLDRISLKNKTK